MSENDAAKELFRFAIVNGWTIEIDGLSLSPDYANRRLHMRSKPSSDADRVARLEADRATLLAACEKGLLLLDDRVAEEAERLRAAIQKARA